MTVAAVPRATMRLQLNHTFTFDDAAALAPYMAQLGMSHLYASPIFAARPGSMHGYDVTDPTRINPELGGEDGFRRLVDALRAHDLGLIVDIVPNHMAAGSDNAWWVDVLQHGRASRYANFFDIDWRPLEASLQDKVLLPILGQSYAEALTAGEIQVAQDESQRPVLRYFDHALPVSPDATPQALRDCSAETLPGRLRLHRLLQRQHYRLAWWRVAADEINWRRFFDINDLVALRMEDEAVFEATHTTLFRLYAEGLIDGVRVDHIDGLTDPRGYCQRLRARLRELAVQRPKNVPPGPAYVVVEKILGRGESLARDWQIDGTTGYDFMDAVNAVQHDADGATPLATIWSGLTARAADFAQEEVAARREIIERSFTAQLDAVTDSLHRLATHEPASRDLSRAALRRAVTDLLAHFPVYRTYVGSDPDGARSVMARVLADVRRSVRGDMTVIETVARWLTEPEHDPHRRLAAKFEQLSAPVAAKAVEDTAFYRYGRLLSRNDVGFDAATLGGDIAAFHDGNVARARDLPAAMLATATHDHKRGEDVRARLAVLSEMPTEWHDSVNRWMAVNERNRPFAPDTPMPSIADEVMLYQTIVGAWPTTLDANDHVGIAELRDRLIAWQTKALREAKLATDWSDPNPDYEDAASSFLQAAFQSHEFVHDIAAFANTIAPAGAINGLAQVVLKLCVPGVPDFYQGTEFWDQSLVDPDNRRPVDFSARAASLQNPAELHELLATWRDGRIKQVLIRRLLQHRAAHPALFARGRYAPLEVAGGRAEHVIAFARQHKDRATVVVVPRLPWALRNKRDGISFTADDWGDTAVLLPASLVVRAWHDIITAATRLTDGKQLPVGQLLSDCPVAVLAQPPNA